MGMPAPQHARKAVEGDGATSESGEVPPRTAKPRSKPSPFENGPVAPSRGKSGRRVGSARQAAHAKPGARRTELGAVRHSRKESDAKLQALANRVAWLKSQDKQAAQHIAALKLATACAEEAKARRGVGSVKSPSKRPGSAPTSKRAKKPASPKRKSAASSRGRSGRSSLTGRAPIVRPPANPSPPAPEPQPASEDDGPEAQATVHVVVPKVAIADAVAEEGPPAVAAPTPSLRPSVFGYGGPSILGSGREDLFARDAPASASALDFLSARWAADDGAGGASNPLREHMDHTKRQILSHRDRIKRESEKESEAQGAPSGGQTEGAGGPPRSAVTICEYGGGAWQRSARGVLTTMSA